MYAVVNTMNRLDDSLETIESQHRTLAAAVDANKRLQAAVKRANGSTSYLPTVIVELIGRPAGRYLGRGEYREVDEYARMTAEQTGRS